MSMGKGQAKSGSQHWMQIVANDPVHKRMFDDEINDNLKWLSPLADSYEEYKLNDKKCFELLKDDKKFSISTLEAWQKELESFWPSGGPRWDGIALSHDEKTMYLVEAKSWTGEMRSEGSKAKSSKSLDLINSSLKENFERMRKSEAAEFRLWTSDYYQLGNRLVFLHKLNDINELTGLNVKLVLLNFVNDDTHNDDNKLTNEVTWTEHYKKVFCRMTGSTEIQENIYIINYPVGKGKTMDEKYWLKWISNEMKENPNTLYRCPELNNTNRDDEGTKYTELIARAIYEMELEYDVDERFPIARAMSDEIVKEESIHTMQAEIRDSNREEENIAKIMFNQKSGLYWSYGKSPDYRVCDYQVPVNRIACSNDGKIDLVASGDNNTILCELKGRQSRETLLRAVMEIETYFRKVSKENLEKMYGNKTLGKAVLVFPDTQPYFDYENDFWIKKLCDWLDITVYCVVNDPRDMYRKICDIKYEMKRM